MSLPFRDNGPGYIRWARNRRRRLSGFTPLDLPGLLGWWDCSIAGSITTATGGVSQLDDASGNGEHATQSTESRRATETTLNSLVAIDFNQNPSPADEQLVNSTITLGTSQTAFGAWQPRTDASFSRFAIGNGAFSGSDQGFRLGFNTTDNVFFQIGDGSTVPQITGASFTDQETLVLVGYYDPPNLVVRVNGSESSRSDISGGFDASRTGNLALSANFSGATVGELKGILGECGICGILDSAQIASLETYLADKWGATLV